MLRLLPNGLKIEQMLPSKSSDLLTIPMLYFLECSCLPCLALCLSRETVLIFCTSGNTGPSPPW